MSRETLMVHHSVVVILTRFRARRHDAVAADAAGSFCPRREGRSVVVVRRAVRDDQNDRRLASRLALVRQEGRASARHGPQSCQGPVTFQEQTRQRLSAGLERRDGSR